MWEAFLSGLNGLLIGFGAFTWQNGVMICVAGVLLFLGIKKGCEPLLLIPIGFSALLMNIPMSGLMDDNGLLRHFYYGGVMTEIFPCLIFIGIGATREGEKFLHWQTLIVLGLGFVAICFDTAAGVLSGKLMCFVKKEKSIRLSVLPVFPLIPWQRGSCRQKAGDTIPTTGCSCTQWVPIRAARSDPLWRLPSCFPF